MSTKKKATKKPAEKKLVKVTKEVGKKAEGYVIHDLSDLKKFFKQMGGEPHYFDIIGSEDIPNQFPAFAVIKDDDDNMSFESSFEYFYDFK